MRLIRVIREDGVRAACIKGLHELGIYRRLHLLDIPNTDAANPSGCDLPLAMGVLEPEEIDAYLALRPDQSREMIQTRIDSGDRCFTGRHEGVLVTTAWSAAGIAPIDYLECALRLPDDAALTYDVYTHPDARGHRVSMELFDWRRRRLREAGYRRSIGLLWPENPGAVRRIANRPHSVFGSMALWRIGPWRRHVLALRSDPDGRDPRVSLEADRGTPDS